MKTVIIFVLLFVALALADVSQFTSKKLARDVAAAADDYWTLDNMLNAIPLDDQSVPAEAEGDRIVPHEARNATVNAPQSSDGHDSIYFPSTPEEIEAVSINNNKRIGQYAPVDSYTVYPWRTVGKIFFTKAGLNYVCSGSVIKRNVISTAGHCVYDGSAGGFVTNFIFVPGYHVSGGVAMRPYGTWYARQLRTTGSWANNAAFCQDYAFAVMWDNSGAALGDVVGILGWSINNDAPNTIWTSLGYPQAAPHDGTQNFYSTSGFAGSANPGCTPNTIGLYTSATPGSSGGPWVINFGADNYLNGLNSYKYDNYPDIMFGPYFDNNWLNSLNAAEAISP